MLDSSQPPRLSSPGRRAAAQNRSMSFVGMSWTSSGSSQPRARISYVPPVSCQAANAWALTLTSLRQVREVLRTTGVLPEAQGSAGIPEGIIIMSAEEFEATCQRVFNRASEMIFQRKPCTRGQERSRCNENGRVGSAKGKERAAASTPTPAETPAIPAAGLQDDATPGATSTGVPAEVTAPSAAAWARHEATPGESSTRGGDGPVFQDGQSLFLDDHWGP